MLIWHGKSAENLMGKEARARVQQACLLVERTVKHSMKAGGRTISGGKAQKGEKYRKIGTFRSKPGEVPRVQFGKLKGSIGYELDPKFPIGRVGTNTVYAKPLEFGTANMEPRPFMRPALEKTKGAIRAIFNRPFSRLR